MKKAVIESGIKVTHLAKAIHKDPKTIYNWYQLRNVPLDNLLEIGKFIKHDFADDIPEMRNFLLEKSQVEVDYKQKYIDLLEEHNILLKAKHEELLQKLANNNKLIEFLQDIKGELISKKNTVPKAISHN